MLPWLGIHLTVRKFVFRFHQRLCFQRQTHLVRQHHLQRLHFQAQNVIYLFFLILETKLFHIFENKKVIMGTKEKKVMIYDPNTLNFNFLSGHTDTVSSLKLVQNDLLASGSTDREIIFWNLTTLTEIKRVQKHSSAILTLESFIRELINKQTFKNSKKNPLFFYLTVSNGDILLASSGDTNIIIWDMSDFTQVKKISQAHDKTIWCLKWLGPNSGYFASASEDTIIKIWDTRVFKFIRRLIGHSEGVRSLEILTDGRLMSASLYNLKIWNLNLATVDHSQSVQNLDEFRSIKLLNNGDLAIVGVKPIILFWTILNPINQLSITSNNVPASNTSFNGVVKSPNNLIATYWGSSISLSYSDPYTFFGNIETNHTISSIEAFPYGK